MLTLIHGGPFSASYCYSFSKIRSLFMMQGFALLIVNFRGTIGYGENLMNTLLGTIGENDVNDCG
jgi:acylaminoacyl-peptidase